MWQTLWGHERLWLILSMLSVRAVGFLTSLMISRWGGPAALGVYAAVVNVAGATVAQVAQVMQNNAAIMAGGAGTQRAGLVRAHLLPLLCMVVAALAVFGLLAPGSGLSSMDAGTTAMVWLAAASVIVAQLAGGVATGLNQGVGQFVAPARAAVLAAGTVVLVSLGLIIRGGLYGGLISLILNSWATPVIGLLLFLRPGMAGAQPATVAGDERDDEPMGPHRVWGALWQSAPAVGTAVLTAGCAWFCGVYLVNRLHGVAGVGMNAVGIQWSTIMLVPATSWAGIVFKRLMDAQADPQAVMRKVHLGLIGRNLLVTAALALTVAACGSLIAGLYKLPAVQLWPVLMAMGCYAMLVSINGVTERLLYVRGQQFPWLLITLCGCLVQVGTCLVMLPRGLYGQGLGLAASELSILILSWFFVYGRSCTRS